MRALLLAAVLLGAGGCSLFQVEVPPAQPADDLLAADRQFSRRAQLGAPEAVREFFEAQGIWLEATGTAVIGREKIAAEAGQRRNLLSWEPRFAEVAPSGDWGWTWGDWQLQDTGKRTLAQGRYLSLWKKQTDGSWQVRSQLTAQAPR